MTSKNNDPNKEDSKIKAANASSDAQIARDARLAENLRANLRRRKAASRKIKINENGPKNKNGA